ncbi:MAG TPA: hypothetical protein VM598_00305, partial [Bdellovibrionota bacterium]|nr:hypothetical protein [Bdellovibrionota bacterium]
MWDVPRYRIRAYVRALKRARSARKHPREFEVHFKRVKAELRIIEGFASKTAPTPARLILNEMTPLGTYVFARSPFREGQIVELTLNDPKLFYVKGRILSCDKMNPDSVIMSEDPVPYRVAIAFTFQSLYEREM